MSLRAQARGLDDQGDEHSFYATALASLRPAMLDGIGAGAQVLVWGAAWLWVARLGWRERSPREKDQWHDLAVYVLSGFALVFLAIGLYSAAREILGTLVSAGHPTILAAPAGALWATWGTIAAWTLAGGGVWLAIWRYDLARGGCRALRTACPRAPAPVARDRAGQRPLRARLHRGPAMAGIADAARSRP